MPDMVTFVAVLQKLLQSPGEMESCEVGGRALQILESIEPVANISISDLFYSQKT